MIQIISSSFMKVRSQKYDNIFELEGENRNICISKEKLESDQLHEVILYGRGRICISSERHVVLIKSDWL